MKKDGLTPIAFADKDGWPAMGTFDILNMRINGYQFHIDLMAGKEAWNRAEVKKVFDTWKALLPYHQAGSLGRTWQEAAQSLQQKKAGMYLLGHVRRPAVHRRRSSDDLDFFTFPAIDPTIGADAVDAPIDGFMMARSAKNEDGAKDAARVPGLGRGGEHLPSRPTRATSSPNSRRRRQRLHRAAEEGGRARRRGQEHRPVPGPGHPARLRRRR